MSSVAVVKSLAGCASLVMILSPAPAMVRVWKTGNVGLLSVVPLASLLANSHVWWAFSLFLRRF